MRGGHTDLVSLRLTLLHTQDDGDFDMGTSHDDGAPSPLPVHQQHTDTGTIRATPSRRAVGIVSDTAAPAVVVTPGVDLPSDAHIIQDKGVVPGVGVEDSIVTLETNDDFVMGAPPGLLACSTSLPTLPARSLMDTQALASAPPVRARRTSPCPPPCLRMAHSSPHTWPSTLRWHRGTGTWRHQPYRIPSGRDT